MSEGEKRHENRWKILLRQRIGDLQNREDQVFLVLALVIGALTGLAVVAFILLTERLGMRLYPVGILRLAASAHPRPGIAGHGLSAVPLFSVRAGQRRAANEGCAVCARRRDHASHDLWKILLHVSHAGQWNPPWARRTLCPGWRWHSLGAGAPLGTSLRASKEA